MRPTSLYFLVCVLGLSLGACDDGTDGNDGTGGTDGTDATDGTGDDHELPMVDCGAVTVPTYAQVRIFERCTECHSSELTGAERQDAPVGVDYDTYASAAVHAEHGAGEVYAGEMPPLPPIVPDDVKLEFYAWALCDTPQ